jgi:hypothetical protein
MKIKKVTLSNGLLSVPRTRLELAHPCRRQPGQPVIFTTIKNLYEGKITTCLFHGVEKNWINKNTLLKRQHI